MPGSNPGLVFAQIPTAAQWNGYYSAKFDFPIASIAALRTLSTNATAILVEGYYGPTTPGGGVFVVGEPATDNGGTIINDGAGNSWYRLYDGPLNVEWFGAVHDGASDDTAPIAAAIAAAVSVYFAPGTYLVSANISITRGTALHAAPSTVFFEWTSPTLQFLTMDTTSPCSVIGLSFIGVGSGGGATGGAALTFTAPGSGDGALNFQSIIRDCQFVNQYTGINFVNAAYFVHDSCVHNQYVSSGIIVQNLNQPDAGDSCVSNSLFDGFSTSADGVIYTSSGGLKITNTKFVTGNVGVAVSLANTTTATGDLLMSNVSIEGFATAAIQFSRAAGTGTFSHITLSNLQIGLCAAGISVATPGVFANVSITGCDIAVNAAGNCVSLIGVSNFTIDGNTLFANAGGGSGSGIVIDSQCGDGKVGVNSYSGLATTLNNASTTTWYARDVQTATGTIAATNTAYGALFVSAGLPITFPTAFTVAPTAGDINVSATATTAAPLGFLVESVSATGFTLVAVTAQNSGTVSFAYSAAGVI